MTIPHSTRRTAAAAVVVGLTLAVTACSTTTSGPADPSSSAPAYPLTIENCGEPLTIESEPRSILTIGTSALSLLDAAGAADRIVARSGEFGAALPDDLSTDLSDVPIVDPSDPTTEKIVGAGADVVVGYGVFNSTDEDLAAAGVTNIVIDGECSHDDALTDATDFDAIFSDVERLGAVFGTEDVASARVDALREELSGLEETAPERDAGSAAVVYYFSSSSTLSARGGQGIANDVLDRAGLENIYGDEPSVYLETNVETLLDEDPTVIVIAYGLYGEDLETATQHLLSEPGAEDLTAVKNDAIIGVPASDLSPDPDAIRGLRAVLDGVSGSTE